MPKRGILSSQAMAQLVLDFTKQLGYLFALPVPHPLVVVYGHSSLKHGCALVTPPHPSLHACESLRIAVCEPVSVLGAPHSFYIDRGAISWIVATCTHACPNGFCLRNNRTHLSALV